MVAFLFIIMANQGDNCRYCIKLELISVRCKHIANDKSFTKTERKHIMFTKRIYIGGVN